MSDRLDRVILEKSVRVELDPNKVAARAAGAEQRLTTEAEHGATPAALPAGPAASPGAGSTVEAGMTTGDAVSNLDAPVQLGTSPAELDKLQRPAPRFGNLESTSEQVRDRASQEQTVSGVFRGLAKRLGIDVDDVQRRIERGEINPASTLLDVMNLPGATGRELVIERAKASGLPDDIADTLGTASELGFGVLFPPSAASKVKALKTVTKVARSLTEILSVARTPDVSHAARELVTELSDVAHGPLVAKLDQLARQQGLLSGERADVAATVTSEAAKLPTAGAKGVPLVPALTPGQAGLAFAVAGIAALGEQSGDTSEDTVTEYFTAAGLVGLLNPRATKALARAARLIRRKTPALTVSPATVEDAERVLTITPDQIKVGDKLIHFDWSAMGHSADSIRDTVQALKQVYDVEGVHEVSRGVVRWKDERTMAKHLEDLGFDAQAVLKRQPGEALNSTEIQASVDVWSAAVKRVDELADEVRGLADGPERAAKLQELQLQMGVAAALTKQVDGAGEEAGRALNMFRSAVQDIGGARADYLRQYGEMAAKGLIVNPDRIPDLWRQLPDQSERTSFLRLLGRHGWDLATEMFYNSWLSTIKGQLANIAGNAQATLTGPIVKEIAAGIGALRGTEGAVDFRQGAAMVHGMWASLGEAIVAGGKAAMSGESRFGGMKAEARALTGARFVETLRAGGFSVDASAPWLRAVDVLGTIVGAGTRTLNGVDEFFKVINFNASMFEQATVAGLRQGLEGPALGEFVARFVKELPEDAVAVARKYAEYTTFTQPLEGTLGAVERISRSPVMLPFVPFFKVLANSTRFEFEHMPGLNLLVRQAREDLFAGGARTDLASAKLALGSTMLGFAAYLAMSGKITGRGPTDTNLLKTLTDQGWQPHALVVDNADGSRSYIGVNRMDPHVAPFLLVADIVDVYSELMSGDTSLSWDKADELALAATLAFYENFTSKTWMAGFAQATEALTARTEKDAEKFARFLRKTAAGVAVPAGLKQITDSLSPEMKETYSLLDEIRARVWWAAEAKDPKTGEPLLYPQRKLNGDIRLKLPALGPDWASPLPYTKGQPDPVSMAILQNRVSVSALPKAVMGHMPELFGVAGEASEGVPLTPKQRDRWAVLAGNGLKLPASQIEPVLRAFGYEGPIPDAKLGMWDLLTKLVETPKFQELPSGPGSKQAEILRSVIGRFRTVAERKLLLEDEELRNKVIDKRLERARLAGASEADVSNARASLRSVDFRALNERLGLD